jgi:hypothetical protein
MIQNFEQLVYMLGLMTPISLIMALTEGQIQIKAITYITSIVFTMFYM